MPDKKVEVEIWECFVCNQEVEVKRISSPAPDAPDFFTVPVGSYLTCMVVDYDDEDEPDEDEDPVEEFVVCCTAKCVQTMLAEYDAPPDRPTQPEGTEQ